MPNNDFIVRISHLRAAGYCNREPRVWFARQGLSWSDFATQGINASVLVATGDPLALKVVEIARKDIPVCRMGWQIGSNCPHRSCRWAGLCSAPGA